jgi:CRISPR-associated endonuclease Cas1/CRISPR-associated protein Cas4
MDAAPGIADCMTIDIVHQFAYCPRRMHLMYVDGRWDDNLYTAEGRSVHARVDDAADPLPPPPDDPDDPPVVARSVSLGSEKLGLSGKLDLLEIEDGQAVPVDTKRGRVPLTPQRCYEPERVQLMCQGLLLREHGHRTEYGVLYFAEARRRVRVDFTAELEARTRHLIAEARAAAQRTDLPEPLSDSPKCNGCSLSGICLPDETNLLTSAQGEPADIRRLYPAREDALPLYVQEQGARVGKAGEAIQVEKGSTMLGEFPLKDISQLVLCGNISVSAPCLHLLCERGIPIVHLSRGHWFYGVTAGINLRNAYDRAAQFSAAADDGRRLALARVFVRSKAQNQRTLLRRNAGADIDDALEQMRRLNDRLDVCHDTDELMGVEGSIAAIYFANWGSLLTEGTARDVFAPASRNRRPPKDPVNAMLSFGYALLAKECTVALLAEGLDPHWGFLHRPRHGRPALALDLMEEFRPLVVDSAVLSAINTGMVSATDFVISSAGCAMKDVARKALIRAYELRLDQMITHPLFDYRCSWRAVIRVQARLLAKVLRKEIPAYIGITTR